MPRVRAWMCVHGCAHTCVLRSCDNSRARLLHCVNQAMGLGKGAILEPTVFDSNIFSHTGGGSARKKMEMGFPIVKRNACNDKLACLVYHALAILLHYHRLLHLLLHLLRRLEAETWTKKLIKILSMSVKGLFRLPRMKTA